MCGWQLLFLFLFVSQVNSDCVLSEAQLNDCMAVITLNGELLRSNKINEGEKLNVYPIDGQTPKKNFVCMNGQFSPDFPKVQKKDRCARNTLLFMGNLGFDSYCHGNIYNVFFKIDGKDHELYRTCYDKQNFIARYTEGYIYSKDGPSANRPPCSFTLDRIMSGYEDSSITRTQVKRTFGILYQSKYSIGDSNSQDNIDRGHLTPADDYLTYAQKAATFKMINAIPQFHRYQAQGGNWFKIEEYIRSLASKNKPRIHVQTGTHEVLKLTNSQNNWVWAYLHYNESEDKWKYPIPAWVYKFVKNDKGIPIYASITYNNPYADATPAAPSFCKSINCNMVMSPDPKHGITYCCKPDEFTPVFHQPTDVSCTGLGMKKPNEPIPERKRKRGTGEETTSTEKRKPNSNIMPF